MSRSATVRNVAHKSRSFKIDPFPEDLFIDAYSRIERLTATGTAFQVIFDALQQLAGRNAIEGPVPAMYDLIYPSADRRMDEDQIAAVRSALSRVELPSDVGVMIYAICAWHMNFGRWTFKKSEIELGEFALHHVLYLALVAGHEREQRFVIEHALPVTEHIRVSAKMWIPDSYWHRRRKRDIDGRLVYQRLRQNNLDGVRRNLNIGHVSTAEQYVVYLRYSLGYEDPDQLLDLLRDAA